jgi:hypothetical protein
MDKTDCEWGFYYSSQFQPPYNSEIENCIIQNRSIVVMIKIMPNHCLKLFNIRNVTDNPGIVEKAVYLITASKFEVSVSWNSCLFLQKHSCQLKNTYFVNHLKNS